MRARYQGVAIHSQAKTGKISAAQAQAILSRTLRGKANSVCSSGESLKDAEQGVVSISPDVDSGSTID
jgi:hypothetical protein